MKKISILFATLFLLSFVGHRAMAQCTDGTDCYIVIEGWDAYGDGWNGNSISLSQGTTSLGSFTLSSGSNYVDTIRVCTANGDISLTWNTGSWSYEASFTITDSLGSTLYSCDDGSTISGLFATIAPCPTCPAPANINANAITSSSATVSWTEVGSATMWLYSSNADGPWVLTSTNSIDYTDLNANTLYHVYLRSYCSVEDTSAVVEYTFRTACGTPTLPIVEGFEDNGSNIPFCWTILETQYDYGTYPAVYSWNGYNSSQSLAMESYNGPVSIATPQLPVAANTIEVKMWVRGEAALQVGYVTDLDSLDFHLVGTAGPTTYDQDNWSYAWEEFTVDFDTVTYEGNVYVVIRRAMELSYNSTYVDDITLRQINNCADPTGFAEDLTVASASGQMSLTWDAGTATQWEVAYGPTGFDPDTATANRQTTYSNSITITGLNDQTNYDFYVRTVCGTQSSYWVGPVQGRPNVYVVTATVDTVTSCGVTITDDGGYFDDFSANNDQTIVLQPAADGQTIRIRGFAHLYSSYSSYYQNIMRIFAGTDTNGMLLANINSVNVDNIDITSEIGAMTIHFISCPSDYYANEGFALYVSCEDLPDCTTPYNLEVSNISGSTATVTWDYSTELGDANGFTIELIDLTDSSTVQYTADGADRSLVVSGLNERTFYMVRLAVDCEGVDTISTSFVTPCIAGGELQIGTGTNTSSYLPNYMYYAGALSQQIFTAEEFGSDTAIYGFRFYMTSSASTDDRQWNIYLDTTSISSYTTVDDYVLPTVAERHFQGTVTFQQGWNEVMFDTPFFLSEGKNMVLTINDINPVSSYNSRSFRVTNTSSPMALYGYSYGSMIDATDSNWTATAASYGQNVISMRSNFQFLTPCASTDCLPPAITSAVADTHSVSLEWMAQGGEYQWIVEYRNIDSTDWIQVTSTPTNETSYEVTNLDAATTYRFRVSSICGDDTVAALVNATTLCGNFALPYFEDFENFTATSYEAETQMCWYRASGYTYSSYYPYISTYSSYAYEGTRCLNMCGYKSRLVFPSFEAPIDSLSIDFYAMCSYYSTYYDDPQVEVGVCTNPADTSTYVVLNTFTLTAATYEYDNFTVDFDSYEGTDGHIFLRCPSNDYAYIYIDNVTVSRIPSCRNLSGASIGNITTNSVDVTVSDNFDRNNYTIYWSTANDTTTLADSTTTATTTATITGLTANTTYYMWARAICSATDHSKLYAIGSVSTLCNPIAVTNDASYFNDFEDGTLDCFWQTTENQSVAWTNSTYGYSGAHAYSGGYRLNIGSSQNVAAMLVLPTFDFSGLGSNAEVSFYNYWYYYTNSYSSTITYAPRLEVYYRIGDSGNWTYVADVDTSVRNAWRHYYIELPASQGAPVYQVAFKATTNGNSYGTYIDDLTVEKVTTCLPPTNIVVDNITERTATVHWTGTASSYKVQYRSENNWNWNARTVEGVDSCVISPLDMASRYEVRVLSQCGVLTYSDPSEIVTFSTEFCADRSESTNYEDTATDASMTKLFNINAYTAYTEIIIDSAMLVGMSDINGLSFYIDDTYDHTQIGNCRIYMGHTTATELTALLYSDTTFTEVFDGSIGIENGWNRVLIDPYTWDGTSNLVVGFLSINNNYYNDTILYGAHVASANKCLSAYYSGSTLSPDQFNMVPASNKTFTNIVPDLKFYGCNPTCYEPVFSKITTTESSIAVEWYNENAVIQMEIKPSDEENWDSPVVVIGTNRHTYTNLPGMTDFDIRIRRDCTADDMDFSDWVYAFTRTDTACSIPTDLAVSAITGNSVTLGWTDGPMSGGEWEIRVWNNSFNQYYTVNTNPATVDGLVAGASYQIAVRARCGSDDHVIGEFSDPVNFNNICYPATNLTATVSGNDVVLNWTPGLRNTQWIVTYGLAGFAPNDQIGYQIVNSPTATITGLDGIGAKGTEGFSYGFRVRAICGDDWNSDWNETEATVQVGGVGIDDVDANSRVSISPNPATDQVTLRLAALDAEVSLMSVDGRTMTVQHASNGELTLDVSQLAAGTYFVRVQTANWTTVRKLIVK